MTHEEYEMMSSAIAKKLNIKSDAWTDEENLCRLIEAFPTEVLRYVVNTPKPHKPLSMWLKDWVSACKQEIINRELEKIILGST